MFHCTMRRVATVGVCVAFAVNAVAQTSSAPAPAAELTPEQWIADLDFLAAELPERHKNAFHKLSRAEFDAAVGETRQRLKTCETYERALILSTLVAKLGDSHTAVDWRPLARGFHVFPIALGVLKRDSVVIAGATAEHEALGDCELLKLNGMAMPDVIERVAAVFPADNESWKLFRSREYLSIAEILKTAGVISDLERATLSVRLVDGTEKDVEVKAVPAAQGRSIKFAAHDPVGPAKLSIPPREDQSSYWFEMIPDTKCLYVRYDRCADDPQKPVAKFAEELLERLKQEDWERVIFDLRRNMGGNSALLDPLIAKLGEHEKLKERGKIMLLIGRATYSSGLMNAWRLREATNAVCIGLPTGQSPNHFGEIKWFELPNSKLKVYYSTKRFEMDPQNRPAMEPDVEVGTTLADFRSGRDPALERAIEWKPGP